MSLKHPPGLYVLFVTEMWERFSFYTMAAVFMYYLQWDGWRESGQSWLQDYASLINGLYVGTVYFSPFFGGILADRKIGYFWSIVWGAVFFCVGEFFLAVPNVNFLFLGLLGLVIGNGLFKPNISTLVGKLYPTNDPRLDGAYTIFYMGINLGAFLAPLVAGFLRDRYGFHAAFMAAGFGMIVSLVVFVVCRHWLIFSSTRTASLSVKGVQVGTSAVTEEEVPAEVQRNRNIALLIIFMVVALFWMAFKQNTNTFPLWFRDFTDRTPPSFLPSVLQDQNGQITAEYNALINPFFVIFFSPLLVMFWARMRTWELEPKTPGKVGLGMVLTAAGFAVLWAGGRAGGDDLAPVLNQLNDVVAQKRQLKQGATEVQEELARWTKQEETLRTQLQTMPRVSPFYLVGAFVFLTWAELCLSPMGLSLVSKLASPRSRSAWMGGWFASTAVGGYLSGIIGQFWRPWGPSLFFGVLVVSSLFAALLLLVFLRRLNAAMPAPKPAAG